MAQAKSDPLCPVCGVAAIIKGREEYGGGWLCFKKKGGCGAKWPDGPVPTGEPVVEQMMPRQLPQPSVAVPAGAGRAEPAQGVLGQPPKPQNAPAPVQAPHPREVDLGSDIETPGAGTGGPVFSIGPQHFTTSGVNKEQMVKLFALCPQANRKLGKGYSEGLLTKMFTVGTRKSLTSRQADEYIAALEKVLA